MSINWDDDNFWILSSKHPLHDFGAPYVGNGRLGLRLGALILGTDSKAPALVRADAETCLNYVPEFDHSYPLQTFAAQGRDGFLYCLPSWANIDLHVGGRRFEPRELGAQDALKSWLDLRTGEAGVDGKWWSGRKAIEVRIRLLIPRGNIAGGFWELELDGLDGDTEIIFGMKGRHLSGSLQQSYRQDGDSLIGMATTAERKRKVGLGLSWAVEGADATDVATGEEASVRVRTKGPRLKLRVFHAISGGTLPWKEGQLENDLAELKRGFLDGSLRKENERAWKELWTNALDVTALPLDVKDQRLLLAQQFYLLASYDGSDFPTAPLGLSGNQWKGQMLWDTDLWHFRALNALWPDLARQTVRARIAMLPGARRRAAELGLPGAWFGWMCDEDGNELAPEHYQVEIHVNAWVALAAWESARDSDDRDWKQQVYPLLAEVAQATCKRAERDGAGAWHLRHVVPPDESVVEDTRNAGHCDDAVSTNVAFRTALLAAAALARQLGHEVPKQWLEVANGLVVLGPGKDGIIPEYAGYNGHPIKQADMILAFWPLGTDYLDERAGPAYADDIVLRNLDYYRDRVGDRGPLMSPQIDACIRLRHGFGNREEILRDCLVRYRRHVHGAFEVTYECIGNSNSLFLTGCGGLLQTLIYGWFGVHRSKDLAKVPRLLA